MISRYIKNIRLVRQNEAERGLVQMLGFLRFNTEKCKVMHFGGRVDQEIYKLNGNNVHMQICNSLHPSEQSSKAAKRAMSPLALLQKTFRYLDKEGLPILYNTYVCPHWNIARRTFKFLKKSAREGNKLSSNPKSTAIIIKKD